MCDINQPIIYDEEDCEAIRRIAMGVLVQGGYEYVPSCLSEKVINEIMAKWYNL